MLARIDDSMPGVSVVLRELVTSAQLEALLSGEIDLGLARLPIGTDLLEARLLTREPLVVAVPESHPLATSSRVEVHELDDADVIMFSPTDARYFYDLAVGILGPTRVNYAQYVTQVHTIVALVGAGRGLALVPRSASALRMPGVVFIELVEGGHAQAELHAVWDPQSSNAALHRLVALLAGDGQGATRQHPSN
jgi:DNA-binding transcriptional LysR family regulator